MSEKFKELNFTNSEYYLTYKLYNTLKTTILQLRIFLNVFCK